MQKRFVTPGLNHKGLREQAGRLVRGSYNNPGRRWLLGLESSRGNDEKWLDGRYILMAEAAELSDKSSRVCEGRKSRVMPRMEPVQSVAIY